MYLENIHFNNIPLEWIYTKELPIRTYVHQRILFYELTIEDMKRSVEHWGPLTYSVLMNAVEYFNDYNGSTSTDVTSTDFTSTDSTSIDFTSIDSTDSTSIDSTDSTTFEVDCALNMEDDLKLIGISV